MSAEDDRWEAKAVSEAIATAKSMVDGEFLTPRTTLGSLSDNEWQWIVTAIICAWISCRARGAVDMGTPQGLSIRTISSQEPDPWEQGTVEACLPALGDIVERIGADKPIGSLNKGQICAMIWTAIKLYKAAEAGRDAAETDAITPQSKHTYGQELAAG